VDLSYSASGLRVSAATLDENKDFDLFLFFCIKDDLFSLYVDLASCILVAWFHGCVCVDVFAGLDLL
jgi:hypothetical protein